MKKQTIPIEQLARLRRIGGLARLMDTALRIPGTRVSLGADSVLGLIPRREAINDLFRKPPEHFLETQIVRHKLLPQRGL
jgi:hypothetical protein